MDGFQNQPNATPNLFCQGKGKRRSEADGQAIRLILKKTRPLGTRRSTASPRSDGGSRGRPIGQPWLSAPRLRPSAASWIGRLVGPPQPPRGGSRAGHIDTAMTVVLQPHAATRQRPPGPFLKTNSFEKFQDLTFYVSFTENCNNLIKIGILFNAKSFILDNNGY
jgi:hypothetical protein